jgi:hypothetical protein
MSHLNTIFAVWDDNAEALAADIGEKGVTVRQWRNRGDIPSRSAQLKIIRAAFEKNGTVLRLEDFLSLDERRSLPVHDHAGRITASVVPCLQLNRPRILAHPRMSGRSQIILPKISARRLTAPALFPRVRRRPL